jgi:hypothetical protein
VTCDAELTDTELLSAVWRLGLSRSHCLPPLSSRLPKKIFNEYLNSKIK